MVSRVFAQIFKGVCTTKKKRIIKAPRFSVDFCASTVITTDLNAFIVQRMMYYDIDVWQQLRNK